VDKKYPDTPPPYTTNTTDRAFGLNEASDQKAALLLKTSEKAFLEIFSILGSQIALEELLDQILNFTLNECNADQGSILLIEEETNDLCILASKGLPREIVEKGRIKRNGGIADWVINNNKPLILNDVVKDQRFTSVAMNRDVTSAMCLPLIVRGNVIGTININRTGKNDYFGDHDQNMALIMASQIAVAIDNTRLQESRVNQERLAAIGRTVSGLAHCIKNILNVIVNGSHILDYGIKQKDFNKVAKGWDIVKNSNHFLSQLVLDMLTYSKERMPEYRMLDINAVCRSLITLCREMGRAKNTTIVFESDETLEPVRADEKDIKRCLLNIVVNAIDACGEQGGVIRVSTGSSEKDGHYYIKVEDNGCGIPEEHKDLLFEVFFSTKGSKGTGLGLAVTKKIIDEHQGSIEVTSSVGKGTSFIITLPKLPPTPVVIRTTTRSTRQKLFPGTANNGMNG